jgi:uncharacterized membrane protein
MTDRVKPWILLVSLLVNAALIGFISAQLVRMRPMGGPDGLPRHHHELSDEARALLDRAFAAERPAIDQAMQSMEAEKRRVETLLRAETIDTAALDAALAAMRAANTSAVNSMDNTLRAAAAMKPEERRAFADALNHMPPPGPRGIGGGTPEGRPPA